MLRKIKCFNVSIEKPRSTIGVTNERYSYLADAALFNGVAVGAENASVWLNITVENRRNARRAAMEAAKKQRQDGILRQVEYPGIVVFKDRVMSLENFLRNTKEGCYYVTSFYDEFLAESEGR